MRTIKFRGLSLDGKGWVYGDLKRENDNIWGGRRTYIWIDTDDCEEDVDYVEIDWQSVGQLTGVIDSNNREIYEGDIIKYYDSNMSEEVKFEIFDTEQGYFINTDYTREVIGNIHQNK